MPHRSALAGLAALAAPLAAAPAQESSDARSVLSVSAVVEPACTAAAPRAATAIRTPEAARRLARSACSPGVRPRVTSATASSWRRGGPGAVFVTFTY